jgi:hypothetical protein
MYAIFVETLQMMKSIKQVASIILIQLFLLSSVLAQTKLTLGKQVFELHNVTGSIIKFQGENVLKIERDLNALPFDGEIAEMFINNMKYSSFIVDKMLGKVKKGGVGLYVDIATIGYFKDLKVIKRAFKAPVKKEEKQDGI